MLKLTGVLLLFCATFGAILAGEQRNVFAVMLFAFLAVITIEFAYLAASLLFNK